jgi:hypothetical protein
MTKEEREIIAALEKSRGRPLTETEIRLSLQQARTLGEISSLRRHQGPPTTAARPRSCPGRRSWFPDRRSADRFRGRPRGSRRL